MVVVRMSIFFDLFFESSILCVECTFFAHLVGPGVVFNYWHVAPIGRASCFFQTISEVLTWFAHCIHDGGLYVRTVILQLNDCDCHSGTEKYTAQALRTPVEISQLVVFF